MADDHFGIVGTTQAGAYRVEAVVAEGGFGVVYRAYHDAFQAPVALKCLKLPRHLGDDQEREFLARFKAEAALMFRLSASLPAVVRPLHADKLETHDGRFVPFLAMEWLEGETLDRLIERRVAEKLPPIGVLGAVKMLAPIARALARAHKFPGTDGPVSIVHRDLKPDNIFLAKVNGEQTVKLLDFGIAKARSAASQAAGRTSSSDVVEAFTPGYGAPEQWMPKRYGQTGPWTDVFGLALTVLEVAAGRPIIDGDTAAMMGTACDVQRRPTPRNEGLVVADAVEAVFARALVVDPRDRFADAGAFWDALESSLGLEFTSSPSSSARASLGRGVVASAGALGATNAVVGAEAGVAAPAAVATGAGRSGAGLIDLGRDSGPQPELQLDLAASADVPVSRPSSVDPVSSRRGPRLAEATSPKVASAGAQRFAPRPEERRPAEGQFLLPIAVLLVGGVACTVDLFVLRDGLEGGFRVAYVGAPMLILGVVLLVRALIVSE